MPRKKGSVNKSYHRVYDVNDARNPNINQTHVNTIVAITEVEETTERQYEGVVTQRSQEVTIVAHWVFKIIGHVYYLDAPTIETYGYACEVRCSDIIRTIAIPKGSVSVKRLSRLPLSSILSLVAAVPHLFPQVFTFSTFFQIIQANFPINLRVDAKKMHYL